MYESVFSQISVGMKREVTFLENIKNPEAAVHPETGKKDTKETARWKELKEYQN